MVRTASYLEGSEGYPMTVASVTEIGAASPEGFEAAIREGIERANETLRNIQSVRHLVVAEPQPTATPSRGLQEREKGLR